MKNWVCHCTVSAFDGNGNINAKPTVCVEATDKIRAYREAVKQLEEKYEGLGCTYVNVAVVLVKEI